MGKGKYKFERLVKSMNFLENKKITGVLWGILRVWLGYMWLRSGLGKVVDPAWVGGKAGTAVTGFLTGALAKAAGDHPAVQGWYAGFIKAFALPNAAVFSYLVAFGELITGISLIFGVLTYAGLIASAMMNLNYLFAGSISTNPNMLLLAFILIYVGANTYYYGVDRFLFPKIKDYWEMRDKKDGKKA